MGIEQALASPGGIFFGPGVDGKQRLACLNPVAHLDDAQQSPPHDRSGRLSSGGLRPRLTEVSPITRALISLANPNEARPPAPPQSLSEAAQDGRYMQIAALSSAPARGIWPRLVHRPKSLFRHTTGQSPGSGLFSPTTAYGWPRPGSARGNQPGRRRAAYRSPRELPARCRPPDPRGWFISESSATTSRPLSRPIATIRSASSRASSTVSINAPTPTFTSSTIACAPGSNFFAHDRGSDQRKGWHCSGYIPQRI